MPLQDDKQGDSDMDISGCLRFFRVVATTLEGKENPQADAEGSVPPLSDAFF